MPGIEDWQTRPYDTIQHIFDEHDGGSHQDFVKKVSDYFTQRITDQTWGKIPSVNSIPLDQIKSGTLVKYRCMVQDVFDPQFCLSQYRVTNSASNSSRIECGLFKDVPNLQPNESADFDGRESQTVERQGFYCVPIPGETEWVKELYRKSDLNRPIASSSTSDRTKRTRESDSSDSEQKLIRDEESFRKTEVTEQQHAHSSSKLIPIPENVASSQCTNDMRTLDLNMPLPDEKGVPCIVRVYSDVVELKITDAVEFIGIICMDPLLASVHDGQSSGDSSDQEELQAHEPPASLVPRLHALVTRHLDHNNPSLPSVVASADFKSAVSKLMEDAASLRLELLSLFEHVFFNDRLTAEYLLCHLISSVYGRADVLPLGKLSLNISGCPNFQRYSQFLHHLISQLTPQSVYMAFSVENINAWTLVPKKDYKTNRVTAGMLQLTSGTHLFIDETVLEVGKLYKHGIANLKALQDVIVWQKVDYDFQWHPVPIHTDINVLTLSESESFQPKDVHVPLIPSSTIDENLDIAQHFTKLDSRLTEDTIKKLRSYITACRLIKFSVSEDTQKLIQDDFVEIRREDPKEMSVDDFQRLLGLLRVYCLSHGQDSPSIEMWRIVKGMEEERKAREARIARENRRTE